MKKNTNILSSIILVSTLTLSPVVATTVVAKTQVKQNTISNSLVNTLYRRGLEKNSAIKIVNKFLSVDEAVFALMIQNIKNDSGLATEVEIMDFLATQALMRNSIELDSYASLVNMLHQINNRALSTDELKTIKNIATKNSFITL